MSGEYTLRATNIPAGYTIADEYINGKAIKLMKDTNLFEIPLKETIDQTSVSAQDSTIYVGTKWQPEDNFIKATDSEGNLVTFDQITVEGTVDTEKVGKYEITYRNQAKEAKVTVSVVDDQKTLVVKDSTIYVGDSWQAKDNFVSATNDNGEKIPFDEITFSGTVDTTKEGTHEVTYRLMDNQKLLKSLSCQTKPQFMVRTQRFLSVQRGVQQIILYQQQIKQEKLLLLTKSL